jgi:acetyl esterase/lipase
MIVSLHGGAWCRNDRLSDTFLNEPLARSGVVVASLDWRMPPVAPYPASMADINYAIRWLKSRAGALGGRPDRVGAMGTSSGAHQAVLTAMRPRDPRYAALPGPAGADASLRCVVALWPVIDPLGRYQYARALRAKGQPYPEIVDRVLPCHDQYWQTEAAMAEGNPVMALERGEPAELPPVLYLQAEVDPAHPRPHLERFVAQYRKAGGQVDLELVEGDSDGLKKVGSPVAARAMARIAEFVHKHLA